MKPKLILCLALVLSGGLFGCSTTNNSSGLTCEISVPSLKPDSNGMLQAALVVKNDGSQPIRICTLGNQLRSVFSSGRFDVAFMSGWFFSDAPPREEFYKGVTTLKFKSLENHRAPQRDLRRCISEGSGPPKPNWV